MTFRTLDQAQLAGHRALVRVDLKVPAQDGKVTDDARLRAALPTINTLRRAGAETILISHFGRPNGERLPSMSLAPWPASPPMTCRRSPAGGMASILSSEAT